MSWRQRRAGRRQKEFAGRGAPEFVGPGREGVGKTADLGVDINIRYRYNFLKKGFAGRGVHVWRKAVLRLPTATFAALVKVIEPVTAAVRRLIVHAERRGAVRQTESLRMETETPGRGIQRKHLPY